MADPHVPPKNPNYTTPNPNPNQPYPTNTTTTHIRETKPTNWFAYLLGGAVIVVGIAAFVLSNDDTATVAPAGDNNVTIESPSTAPAPATPAPEIAPAPDSPAADPIPEPPVATTPDPAVPAPDPVAPAPDAGTTAPAPSGN